MNKNFETRKNELKKGSLIRLLIFALPVGILWFVDLADPGWIERVLSTEVVISYLMIAGLVSWKFRNRLRCPQCEGNLLRPFDFKYVPKRHCLHCGLLVDPDVPQSNPRRGFKSLKVRPKFISTILGIGGGLAYYGYSHGNPQLLRAGLSIAAFTIFPMIIHFSASCKSCGYILGFRHKYCSNCGQKVASENF